MAKMTYEQAAAELEEIVSKLESGKLPLDDSLKLFERGTVLVRFCTDYLDKAQLKITELAASGGEDMDK